jgi:hypothetical protein
MHLQLRFKQTRVFGKTSHEGIKIDRITDFLNGRPQTVAGG